MKVYTYRKQSTFCFCFLHKNSFRFFKIIMSCRYESLKRLGVIDLWIRSSTNTLIHCIFIYHILYLYRGAVTVYISKNVSIHFSMHWFNQFLCFLILSRHGLIFFFQRIIGVAYGFCCKLFSNT